MIIPLQILFNVPLIYYQLSQLKMAHVDTVVLNLHHLGEQIKSTLGHHFQSIKINYSEEKPKILGTGGGLCHAHNFLKDEENFFLLNCDFITDLPFQRLLKTHNVSGALATLLIIHEPHEPADLNIDSKKFITAFTKKGKYMFCGVHILENKFFNYLKPGYSCIIKDGYEKLLKNRTGKIKTLTHRKPWYNFGTFDLYLKNQLNMLSDLKNHPFF